MSIETVLTAIIGGLLGGGITIWVAYMQSRNNLKRDYIKIAHELALEEYRTAFEVAKLKGGAIPPIEANMAYYTLFVQELKSKDFSVEKLKEFRKIHKQVNDIYND
jgi:hypothetical protein